VNRPRSNIEILILTKDEEQNLPYSLAAVLPWADRVFIVDSGSTDRTPAIAAEFAERYPGQVRFVVQPWLGYAKQKNWALDQLGFESDWVCIIDADEVVLPELRDELLAISGRPVGETAEAGFYINRYFIFLGHRLRHCGYYPSWNLRLFKRGKARYEEREVHEHMLVDGPEGYLKGHLEHNDRRGLEVYMAKHNRYSTLEAREIHAVMTGTASASQHLDARFFGNALERRRWIKHVLYPRLPAKWLARFVWMYVLKLGFLDGLTGLRFCLFIAAYELLIGLKLIELRRAEKPAVP
jgi:glycosyltransferase involved in cell wall biosynthesis